jgi:hypothetical protein
MKSQSYAVLPVSPPKTLPSAFSRASITDSMPLAKGSAMGGMMEFEIRPPRDGDADLVSRLILWALRETNGKDYSCDVIERVGLSFSPDAVRGAALLRLAASMEAPSGLSLSRRICEAVASVGY